MPEPTVIILSANANNLAQCVRYVQRHEQSPDIIVVDDGARKNIRGRVDGVTWVAGAKPFVYARNVNLGIQAAGDNDVILLNDDALLLTKHGFTGMASIALTHPDIGILSAGINGVVCNPNQRPRRQTRLRYDSQILVFICVYIPRHTIETVGLLDERFTGYGADARDYCRRVMNTGLELAIWDGCVVDHTGLLPSTFRTRTDWQEIYRHNQQLYQEKWEG